MNRRRRCRRAGDMTVSSNPTWAVTPTRSWSPTRQRPWRSTAVHAVDHVTPNLRAHDAGVPSNDATRLIPTARPGSSTCTVTPPSRGAARSTCAPRSPDRHTPRSASTSARSPADHEPGRRATTPSDDPWASRSHRTTSTRPVSGSSPPRSPTRHQSHRHIAARNRARRTRQPPLPSPTLRGDAHPRFIAEGR